VVQEIPGQPRGAFLLDGATGAVLLTCYDKEDGHSPLSLALSPDSRTLAVGYAPYDIILWNAQTGARQKLLKGHSNWVVSLAFSADSKRLISGAGDSTARVWDTESGKEIGRIRFPGESSYVDGVGLSPKSDIAFAVVRECWSWPGCRRRNDAFRNEDEMRSLAAQITTQNTKGKA